MKNPRKFLVLTVAALSAAVAILLSYVNFAAGRHIASVQQEVGKLLGLDIRFASLEVHLWGWPGFAAEELRIADDPRFAATPVLRARKVVLGVKLWPLLLGHVVIDSLALHEPEFQMITDETGLFNLDLLTVRSKKSPRLTQPRSAPAERQPSRVSFAVDILRIDDGRVIYLDRSIREPAELQLADIDLTLRGLEARKSARLRIDAALTEGIGQDVHIEGEFNATTVEQLWPQREMNLTIRLDSLHVPVVARAVTFLRDKIPSGVGVTGPLSLQAQAAGTLARPRFENFMLKAPVLGSSDYNATVTGDIEFSESRSWADAELRGKLTVDPLPLSHLRNLNFFREHLSSAFVTEGDIGLYARFEGTWDTLRVGALVRADESLWKYRDWLRKPLHRPAEIKVRLARQKDKLFFHESEIASGSNQIGFLGFVDFTNEPRLQIRLFSRRGQVREWRDMIFPDLLIGATGKTDLDVVIDRLLLPDESSWSLHGTFKLTDADFNSTQLGRNIESINATITFSGQQAKFANAKFRLGSSNFVLDGVVPNILDLHGKYHLRSTQVHLADLQLLEGGPGIQLKNFSATGTARVRDGALVLDGNARSPEGQLANIEFRDLSTDVLWSATGMNFNNLSLHALDGSLRADGHVANSSKNSGAFELSTQADSISMRALLTRLLPPLREKIEGQVHGYGQFALPSTDGAGKKNTLKGSGQITVKNGAIKNFNLARQLLLRGSGAKVSARAVARLSPGFAKLLARGDTPFDSLATDFFVGPDRIRTDSLVISTPDYTVSGAGWIGFNHETEWNGMIVLSSQLTQEVQRDIRVLRYFLDRRGRLTISFRAEGTIPNVTISLNNRAVAQALRSTPGRVGDLDATRRPSRDSSDEQGWLPNALDQLLNR